MRGPFNSPGHSQRDAGAHQSILSSVKELSRLLHLPKSLHDDLENARHRDAYKQMMVQKEAIAAALDEIVLGVKAARKGQRAVTDDVEELKAENEAFRDRITLLERELALAHSELPDEFPGRGPLVMAGVKTVEEVLTMSPEALVAIEGIGPATADKIFAQYGKRAEIDEKEQKGEEEKEGLEVARSGRK